MSRYVFVCFLAGALFSLWAGQTAHAATKPIHVQPGKVSPSIESGVLTGGQAANGFSLLSVQNEVAQNEERIILSYGDHSGAPLAGEPGFFQVALDRNSKRVVLDLAQLNRTAIDPLTLKKILGASQYVVSSDMTMDPHDGSTNITLNLSRPVKIDVVSDPGAQGRVILRMREIEKKTGAR